MESTASCHPHQKRIVTSFTRPSPDSIQQLKKAYSGFILDRLGKLGVIAGVKSLKPGWVVCGPAVTSLGPDLTVRRVAIDLAQEGDVLVIAAGGYEESACFGDGTARRMMLKGMAGAVIDAATRDARFLREIDFPTFTRGVTPRNHHYPVSMQYGGVNVPVVCGGMLIRPGDVIFGDDDGVVVIPQEKVSEIARGLEEAVLTEKAQRAAMTSYTPFDLMSSLVSQGYSVE
jgi:4-hydroxy-4-methyl-2-oxoglutarate aldolase